MVEILEDLGPEERKKVAEEDDGRGLFVDKVNELYARSNGLCIMGGMEDVLGLLEDAIDGNEDGERDDVKGRDVGSKKNENEDEDGGGGSHGDDVATDATDVEGEQDGSSRDKPLVLDDSETDPEA